VRYNFRRRATKSCPVIKIGNADCKLRMQSRGLVVAFVYICVRIRWMMVLSYLYLCNLYRREYSISKKDIAVSKTGDLDTLNVLYCYTSHCRRLSFSACIHACMHACMQTYVYMNTYISKCPLNFPKNESTYYVAHIAPYRTVCDF